MQILCGTAEISMLLPLRKHQFHIHDGYIFVLRLHMKHVFTSHDAVMDMSATFQTSPLSLFNSLYLFLFTSTSTSLLFSFFFFFFRNIINSGFPGSRKLRNGNQFFFPSLTRKTENLGEGEAILKLGTSWRLRNKNLSRKKKNYPNTL